MKCLCLQDGPDSAVRAEPGRRTSLQLLISHVRLSLRVFGFGGFERGKSPPIVQHLSSIPAKIPVEFLDPLRMATLKDVVVRRPIAATIRLTVPAGGARPAPPVGPALGQYRLNLMAFCKDFNARTQKYKPDTPMAVTITAYKDNTFEFIVKSPSVTWFLKNAAGVESGSGRPGHVVASSITVRHVYEIAKIKQADPSCKHLSVEAICKSIMGTARSMGIQIVKDL
ncbi:hypothetical protein BHE74_00033208 [Ensete ventricosum]|nr:hypothetical protein BHE74_00033208 [Ensete ventricosum]